MSIKKYDITFPKQNYEVIFVSILENGEPIQLNENDKIFFSVKQNSYDDDYKIQKSLNNGITYNESSHKYEIEINSEDTQDMIMNRTYGYDITIYYDGNKPKQKVIGSFKITDKFTLNEVV